MIIPIKNVGQIGVHPDREPHELPINAWSDAENVRFREVVVEKMQGEENAFSAPAVAPLSLFTLRNGADYFWVYGGAAKVVATDGSAHTEIGSGFAADEDIRWTGGALGSNLIINNGVDSPQHWDGDTGNNLSALPDWSSTWTCRSMRTFRNYLFALDVTKDGTRFGQMAKWSDAGGAGGAVPQSWDASDPTKDAGESNGVLAETADLIIDAFPLGASLIIYKEGSTHSCQFIGGNDIFAFRRIFSESGLLSRWCVAPFKRRHFAVTQEDVILHDGVSIESIATDRLRREIISSIDGDNFERSFVVPNYPNQEIWFCLPIPGGSWATRAWIWNWRHNTWMPRELPSIAHANFGRSKLGESGLWSEDQEDWSEDETRWDQSAFSPTARGIILADFDSTKLWRADQGFQFDGVPYTSFVERKGLAFETTQKLKRPTRVLPYIEGTNGETLTIRAGGHNDPDDAPTWDVSATYTIGTDNWIDLEDVDAWRFLAFRFQDAGQAKWRMSRYDVDLFLDGER